VAGYHRYDTRAELLLLNEIWAPQSQMISKVRNDIETTTACPVCAEIFTPNRRQRYCTRPPPDRLAHPPPPDTPTDPAPPPATPRREITVYQCSECGTRRLGRQWCHDCNRPAVGTT